MAQRTASTTLRNSMMLPSPVRLTTRPLRLGFDLHGPRSAFLAMILILIKGASFAPRQH